MIIDQMHDVTNVTPQIVVICRTNFASGIGAVSFAICEMLVRSFPICILSTDRILRQQDFIVLPNGRRIPLYNEDMDVKVSFFCDVIWNGSSDFNFSLTPPSTLKYALLVYDSSVLPARWTQLFNDHFDLVLAVSPHLIDVARNSGVKTPMACIPLPVDLDGMLARPLQVKADQKVTFGSIASFHPRKGTLTLVKAFINAFGERSDVHLKLHSNLKFGKYHDEVVRAASGRGNISISHRELNSDEKNDIMMELDVFVSCSRGEGYSLGPREALAYGKPLVLSRVGGHQDLNGIPGVFFIEPTITIPARYPEIDHGVFGVQRAVEVAATSTSLKQAYEYVRSENHSSTQDHRRDAARGLSFHNLVLDYTSIFNSNIVKFKPGPSHPQSLIQKDFRSRVTARLGSRAEVLQSRRNLICPAYDAGFFSIFNAFISHLVWNMREERCHAVYPDWDVDRLIARQGDVAMQSFCYGRPGDGNLWVRLFKPLYGCTADEMNSSEFLYKNSFTSDDRHNVRKEPLMTYKHAYDLYKTKEYAAWRRQYHSVFARHIQLKNSLRNEIDNFQEKYFRNRYMIAAHVRHPSHTVEQPDAQIAHVEAYIEKIYSLLEEKSIRTKRDEWGVFLATDQESVVQRMQDEFGGNVCFFQDVRRTTKSEDDKFKALTKVDQNKDGHQLQHLVASDHSSWSIRMANEVLKDAYCMADCRILLHVVSNVSTAVSYINPNLEMIFVG